MIVRLLRITSAVVMDEVVFRCQSCQPTPGLARLGKWCSAQRPSPAGHLIPCLLALALAFAWWTWTGAWTWTWAWAVGTSRPTFNSRLPAPAKQGLAFIQRGIGGRGHVQHRHPPSAAKTPSDPNAAKRLPSREHDKGPVALDSVVPLPGDLVRLGRCRVPKLLIAEPARLSC